MKTKINIEELPSKFKGRAETRGFKFTQMKKTEYGYIYRVDSGSVEHYEVFERRIEFKIESYNPTVISKTEMRVRKPGRNGFGVWCFTASSYNRAEEILAEIEDTVEGRIRRKAAKEAKNG